MIAKECYTYLLFFLLKSRTLLDDLGFIRVNSTSDKRTNPAAFCELVRGGKNAKSCYSLS